MILDADLLNNTTSQAVHISYYDEMVFLLSLCSQMVQRSLLTSDDSGPRSPLTASTPDLTSIGQ